MNCFSCLVNILFPELETLVPTLHIASVYAMLSEFTHANYSFFTLVSDFWTMELRHCQSAFQILV